MIGKNENLHLQSLSDKELLLMVSQSAETKTKQAAFTVFIQRYERYLYSLCRRTTWYLKAELGSTIADELYATILMELFAHPVYLLKAVSRLNRQPAIKLRIQTRLSQLAKVVLKHEYIKPHNEEKSVLELWDPEAMEDVFGEEDQDRDEEAAPKKKPPVLTKQNRVDALCVYNKLKKKDKDFFNFIIDYLHPDKNLPHGLVEKGCKKFGMKRDAFMKRKARMVARLRGSE